MRALKAMYDGQKVLFEQEANIPVNSKLIVILLDDHGEDEDWYNFSARNMNRAYGDHEPDYTDASVKEPNPLYEGR